MNYTERADNVYLIDTKMFGFDRYNAAYIVEGKEIALIDTGPATSIKAVRAGILAHGFAIEDISYIMITHEHSDHCGNVASLLRENPKANIYINPVASEYLIDPSKRVAALKDILPEKMLARFGEMEPVPSSRIQSLNDGDVFDLGNGEKLRIIFAPGHQPGGIVILSEKNRGLFINDLVGMNLADAGSLIMFTPPLSDVRQAMESLRKVKDIPVTTLFLGHFGIWDNPKEVIQHALDKIQWLLDIGEQCMAAGKPEEIANRFVAGVMPEVEKIRAARGESFYEFIIGELVPTLSRNFVNYYLDLQ